MFFNSKKLILLLYTTIFLSFSNFGFSQSNDSIDIINQYLSNHETIKRLTNEYNTNNIKISNSPVWLDSLEDNEYINVYDKPGLSWRFCDSLSKTINYYSQNNLSYKDQLFLELESHCKPLGWPNRNTKIYLIEKQIRNNGSISFEPITENKPEYFPINLDQMKKNHSLDLNPLEIGEGNEITRYSLVYFEYTRKDNPTKRGIGWIKTDLLSKKHNLTTFYPAAAVSQNKVDNSKNDDLNVSPNQKNISFINSFINRIMSVTGKCYKPNYKIPIEMTAFDRLIHNDLVRSIHAESILSEFNRSISSEQIVTIDALARTLYGEMGVCFKYGLHYPMAVAKIAYNRSIEKNQDLLKKFMGRRINHIESKTNLCKVATAPSQFNAWIPKKVVVIQGKQIRTQAYEQTLCPPSNKDKNFYLGIKPDEIEHNIWINALKIATEVVLFPNQFAERTKEIEGKDFSSNLVGDTWNGMSKILGKSIEGRVLDREGCVQLWE